MRILVCISSFLAHQNRLLVSVLDEYDRWDEDIDVVLHATHPLHLEYPRLRIENRVYEESIGRELVFAHRYEMLGRLDDYDLFVYSENDILIPREALAAWREAQERLPQDMVCGLLRYEVAADAPAERYLIDCHGDFPTVTGVMLVNGSPHFTLHNQHQGCFILTRRQLQRVIDAGGFLLPPGSRGGYGMLESGASDVFTCGALKKVYPLDRLDRLLVHHLPDKYVHSDDGFWARRPLTAADIAARVNETLARHGRANGGAP